MATYFHGNSEIQAAAASADGLQTIVLMNPAAPSGYIHYPDAPTNLLFLNAAAATTIPGNNTFSSHALPPHTQQFVGIPLPAAAPGGQDPNQHQMQGHHDGSTLHGFLPRMQYNLWTAVDQNATAREGTRAQQGLSLSLSSQKAGFSSLAPAMSGEEVRGSPSSASGGSSIQGVILSSKYLKAAHELLEEVVNVNKNGAEPAAKKKSSKAGGGGSVGGKRRTDVSTAERQEIQMKRGKLMKMMDEVEQRYRQYHHQMEAVVSAFEQAAGVGSARTYTALALETISKQFRCLKDAIGGQIRAANRSLGEEHDAEDQEDRFGGRLKYVDHHLRHQLGMIQHNAWRPQRGLPERSVSVLRAWLFEHFLHPYPKDSDKHMLAKQTGLTRSQVSNWFINARVRLWKPMVEEMYMEEMKENEQNNKGSEDKSSNSEHPSNKMAPPQDKAPTVSESEAASHNTPPMVLPPPGFSFMGSSDLEGIAQGSPKKPRSNEMLHSPNSVVHSMNIDVKPNERNHNHERQGRDGYSFMGNQPNFVGGFGQYPMGDIGRFDAREFPPAPRFSRNGVSLTLGLDSLPPTHQTFLPNQNIQLGRSLDIGGEPNEFGAINTSSPHSTAAFESITMQNPKRFAAQLLPDFVA